MKTFEAEQNGFELPEDYVKYNGKELEVGENDVEYDVDDEVSNALISVTCSS